METIEGRVAGETGGWGVGVQGNQLGGRAGKTGYVGGQGTR